MNIQREQEIVGRWLNGQQAAIEFSLFAMDRNDDLPAEIETETKRSIRLLQEQIVSSIVAHGDFKSDIIKSDPLIDEFLERRATGTLWREA
jgi:hypothetical protein